MPTRPSFLPVETLQTMRQARFQQKTDTDLFAMAFRLNSDSQIKSLDTLVEPPAPAVQTDTLNLEPDPLPVVVAPRPGAGPAKSDPLGPEFASWRKDEQPTAAVEQTEAPTISGPELPPDPGAPSSTEVPYGADPTSWRGGGSPGQATGVAPQAGGDLRAFARAKAQQYGLDPDIFERQIDQESGFNPKAVSPAGAQGIAQFMPNTGRGMGLADPFEPYSALDAAARHMADNLKRNNGDYRFALAAYNAGQGNVDKYGEGVFGDDFAHGQTRDYVRIILGGKTPAAPSVPRSPDMENIPLAPNGPPINRADNQLPLAPNRPMSPDDIQRLPESPNAGASAAPAAPPSASPAAPNSGAGASGLDALRAGPQGGALSMKARAPEPGYYPPDDSVLPPVDIRERGERPYDATDDDGADRSNDNLMAPPGPVEPWPGTSVAPNAIYRQPLGQQPELPPEDGSGYVDPDQGPREGGRGYDLSGLQPGGSEPNGPGTPMANPSGTPVTSPASLDPGGAQPQYEAVGAATNVPLSGPSYEAPLAPRPPDQEQPASPWPSMPGLQPILDAGGKVVAWVQEQAGNASAYLNEKPYAGLPPVQSFGPGEADYQTSTTREQAAEQASQQRQALPIGERLTHDLGTAAGMVTGSSIPPEANSRFQESLRAAGEPIKQAASSAAVALEQATGAPAGSVSQAAQDVSNFMAPVAPVMGMVGRGVGPAAQAAERLLQQQAIRAAAKRAAGGVEQAIESAPVQQSMLPGMPAVDALLNGAPPIKSAEQLAAEAAAAQQRAQQAIEALPAPAQSWYQRKAAENAARIVANGGEPLSPLRWIGQALTSATYSALMGPPTLAVNFLSNMSRPIWSTPKEIVRTGARAIQTGNPSALREYGTAAFALTTDLMDTGKAIIDALAARGKYAQNPNHPMLSGQTVNPIGEKVAQALELGNRVYSALPDAIFGTLATNFGERRAAAQTATDLGLRGQEWASVAQGLIEDARAARLGEAPAGATSGMWIAAQKEADAQGLKGAARVQAIGQWLKDAVDHRNGELVPNPMLADQIVKEGDAIVKQAIDAGAAYSDHQTFREELGRVGRAAKAASGANLPAVGPWITPFFNTNWNVWKALGENTLAGPLLSRNRPVYDKAYDAIVGTAALAGLASYGTDGRITGSGPANADERKLLEAKGWQRYSTLINGVYVPNRYFGFAEVPLNMAGDWHDHVAYEKKDATWQQSFNDVAQRFGQEIQNAPTLSSWANILDAIGGQNAAAGAERYISGQIVRNVPYAATARAIGISQDPNERAVEQGKNVPPETTIGQQVQSGLGMRLGLPVAQDVLGRPKENQQQGVWALAPKMVPAREDPVIQLFQDAQVAIGGPRDKMTVGKAPIDLKPAERREWNQHRGQFVQDYADAYTGNPDFMALPPEQKKKYLDKFLVQASDYADKMLQSGMDSEDLTNRATEGALKKAAGQ